MRAAAALLGAFLLAGVAPPPAPAQAGAPAGAGAPAAESLESLTARAKAAISQSAFESAVKILTEAKTRYPASPRPHVALADLYYDKELYPLALGEYRAAEVLGATDFNTLTQISRSYGKLNQEKESIDYLTKILKEYPDSADTVDDLGWMYFKTHQLDKGEQVLLKGIDQLGLQRGLAMTLGTVYSGMNRYDKSRDYYLKSINEAIAARDPEFTAIAYYNLSLLEHNFYHYNSAFSYTDDSLAAEDRPSGHLARGELFEARMDFAGAEREYLDAYAKDDTPLSKVNLANLYQGFGRLDLARRYGEEVLASKDLAWLLYYGTDTSRHYQDLHELLAAVYDGLAHTEVGRPTGGLLDRVRALFDAGRYAVLSWYHRQRFRQYSLQVGMQYFREGSLEDAWWEFYRGNEAYSDVALKYLGLARVLEEARTPHAAVFYQMEDGKVRHSADEVQQALAGFDPFWEKKQTAEGLLALIPLLGKTAKVEERRAAIIQLFQLNPGALPQAGIGLPLTVEFAGTGWTGREKSIVMRFIRRAGSDAAEGIAAAGSAASTAGRSAPAALPGARHALRLLRDAAGAVHWSVRDVTTDTVINEGSANPQGKAVQRCASLVQTILAVLYSVH